MAHQISAELDKPVNFKGSDQRVCAEINSQLESTNLFINLTLILILKHSTLILNVQCIATNLYVFHKTGLYTIRFFPIL